MSERPTEMAPGPVQPLLTVAEACAALRISRWMFYRLLQERRIRTVKLGARRLVPADAVAQLITQSEVTD